MSLEFPLHDGFFPQISLSREELKYYKRLGKERVAQLVRIIEDADCAYKWSPATSAASSSTSRRRALVSGLSGVPPTAVRCEKAQFLDLQPSSKAAQASTLLKASVTLPDTRAEEILRAVAKVQTRDFRASMRYLHGERFVDGRTLFTFPSSRRPSTTTGGAREPTPAYRAIKWHACRSKRRGDDGKTLDFCYLEYAGRRKPTPGSSVVAFCVQESISREREVPTLENFGVARGYLSRMGLIVSRTHQPNTFRVTSICQIDGDLNPIVRGVLEELMQHVVCAVGRLPGLLARQRVSSLRFVEQWQWVPNADRKACAVCLRGFYFRRKHHCRTCGEVVCSSCALLRELEEPIFDVTHLRVCSACMSSAGARQQALMDFSPTNSGSGSLTASVALDRDRGADVADADAPTSSTSNDTESYMRGLRSPQHNSYEDMVFHMRESRDRDRRASDLAMEVLEAPPPLPSSLIQSDKRSTRKASPQPQDKLRALTSVVRHIREIRDTINLATSEAAEDYVDDGGQDDDDDQDESEVEEFNDMYSEIASIRDALESSVSNFDAALANATGAAPIYYDPSRQNDEMTADQLDSVARITFAAARATSQAGQAFLSTCSSDVGRPQALETLQNQVEEDVASVESFPTVDGSDSTAHSPDPYASSNYDKLMAAYAPQEEDEDDERHSHHSNHTFATNVRRATEIHELEKKIRELQQSLEAAQRKLSVVDSDEPEAEEPAKRQQRLEAVRERSEQMEIESVFEIFGARDSDDEFQAGATSSRSSVSPVAPPKPAISTHELVSELRGVMSSSEVTTRPSLGSRRSQSRSPTSGTASNDPKERPLVSPAVTSSGNGSVGVPVMARKAPTPTGAAGRHSTPSDGSYLHALGTTSSSLPAEEGDSSSDESFETSSDELSLLSSDLREPQFKHYDGADAFFVEEDLAAIVRKNRLAEGAGAEALEGREPSLAGKDERDELRELMAGLVRPRSSSVPQQSVQRSGASSGELGSQDKPSSEDAMSRSPTAHQVDEAVREIRACLASCRCECPSEVDRARKLTSIFKVLRSLQREGVRSKFRTLQHDDIRYAKMLQATPSIIKLLKLAGYVSLQQRLTMRRVDADYLALFLRELQLELRTMPSPE